MFDWFKKKKEKPPPKGDLPTWGPSGHGQQAAGESSTEAADAPRIETPAVAGSESSYPWIAVFFSLSDGVEAGRVRVFAESLAEEPNRSRHGVAKLGTVEREFVQLRMDGKRIERAGLSLEESALACVDRIVSEVGPQLALWDYLGATFAQPGSEPRQIIVRHSERGVTRSITQAGPDGQPVLRALPA
ncbi:MAG: hypothetical protein H6811_11055 [Phycisphaeraceae bacterium]|nr:hypothetical protein [Phycisphaeraceae bacterium]